VALLVPVIHPAVALRTGQQITDVIGTDLAKAHRLSEEGWNLEENILWVLPGNELGLPELMKRALAWMQHWRRSGARLGVDVETSAVDYFSCKLYSIALGEAESHTAIAFTLTDFHTLPVALEAQLVHELRALLADEHVEKVFHNAPFDLAVLHRKELPVRGPILDTQGMHHLVQPDIQHNLGWVGQTYLDVGPWKLDHQSGKMANTKDPVELLIYNARDALYTALLVEPLKRAIEARGMSSNLIAWQAAYAQLATEMEIAGLPVNVEKRRAMAVEMRDRAFKLRHDMREYLGWADFNPMSDSHRREALFSQRYAKDPWHLGLQHTLLTKKLQQPSTGFKSIIDHLEHPFVRLLTNYVETWQAYATQYQDGTLRAEDGRMEKPGGYQKVLKEDNRLHPTWKPNTLNSARMGSSPNVQNQRKKDRAFIEAPEGRIFIGSDKDQLELRIAACLAGVSELITEMRRPGGDPHKLSASHVYAAQWTGADDRQKALYRTLVKNVTYASIYLAGVLTVWRTIRNRKQLDSAVRAAMTLPVVRHIHSSYFMRYMEFPRRNEALLRFVETNGYWEIPPLGRRRYCPMLPAPATDFANWSIQCYTADARLHTVEGLPRIADSAISAVQVPGAAGTLAVAQLLPRGRSELLSVQLSNGARPLLVTPDHKWLCLTKEEYCVKRAADLTATDAICTELPPAATVTADAVDTDAAAANEWAYWLGAIVSDGATTQSQYDLFFGTAKNFRADDLAQRYARFAVQRGWGARDPEAMKQNLLRVKVGTTATERERFRADMATWGYDCRWTCYFKRVPSAVYTSGREGIRQFVLGMLNGDGAQFVCAPSKGRKVPHAAYNFHMANKPLLEDMQLLCTYLGIESRLCGPFHPDKGKPHISWRLDLHAYDVETVLLSTDRRLRARSRQSRGPLAPLASCEAFLQAVPSNPFPRGSSATLYRRLQTGGSTAPWTLRELYTRAGCPAPPLYSAVPIKAIEYVPEAQDVFTLSVLHPLHQYLAEGTVTMNCLGADVVTTEMCRIQDDLRKFDNAYIIKHGHDEVVVECNERDVEACQKIVDHHFGATPLEGPAGTVMLTAKSKIGKTLMAIK
jgi:DNA polymerase I-like protein with 3'-5' exonuclease and polymerase domains